MTATAYRCQVSIPLYGDPDQNTSNSIYFLGAVGSSTAQDLTEALLRLTQAYQGWDNTIYPSSIVGTTATVTTYDMADAEPRTPLDISTFGIAPAAGTAHPSDVSICLSYRADYPSGANRARRRGRIYLGPLLAATGTNVAGQGLRVSATAIAAIQAGAEDLNTVGVTPITWAMWSQTDGVARPIVEASIDNQFDTRRSRDNQASTRTTFAV
jgi:hypothetical protein